MSHITRTVASAAILTAAFVAVATPAHATPDLTIDVGDYQWGVKSTPFGIEVAEWDDGETPAHGAAFNDRPFFATWNDLADGDNGYTEFTCVNPSQVTDDHLDVIVGCDPMTDRLGLTIDGEIRFYSEGDLARQLVTVTNETSAAIDYSWVFYANFDETVYRATSTTPNLGEVYYVNGDLWSYNEHGDGGLNAGIAWGVPGVTSPHQSVADRAAHDLYVWNDADDDDTQLTLAAGASLTLAFFFKLDPTGSIDLAPTRAELAPATANNDPAVVMAEFARFDGRLTRGLDVGAVVGNWGTVDSVAEESAPELAATGVSGQSLGLGLGLAGGLTLLLGAGLLALRTARRGSASTI